jgi:hypothetical protein
MSDLTKLAELIRPDDIRLANSQLTALGISSHRVV